MLDRFSDPQFAIAAGALLIVFVIAIQRSRIIRTLVSLGLWGMLGFVLWTMTQGGGLGDHPMVARIASAIGVEGQQVVGEETRVPMAADGHFWVTATINGTRRRMMVDSGATLTAVPPATAAAAGLDDSYYPAPVVLRTANGAIPAQRTNADELRIGNIVARDLGMVVSPGFGDTHVLGMNFLSRLKSWRVEGRTLILTPHHPQGVGSD